MLDKIKNIIRNNIWGWSFLIIFVSWGLLIWRPGSSSDGRFMIWGFGGLLFFYGMSIQKQVTLKNAMMVGAKVFFLLCAISLLFWLSLFFRHWEMLFILLMKYVLVTAILVLVFTVVACLLNLIVKQKGQVEDKIAESKKVVNEDERKINSEMWYWCAVKAFLIVALLTLIADVVISFVMFQPQYNGGMFDHLFDGYWGAIRFRQVLIYKFQIVVWELFLAFLLLKCFKKVSMKKTFFGGCFVSLIVYGGVGLIFCFIDMEWNWTFIESILQIVAFALIYPVLLCIAAKKLEKSHSKKDSAHKIKG